MVCMFIHVIGNDTQKLNKSYPNRYACDNFLVCVSIKRVPSENGQGNDVEVGECFHGLNEQVFVNADIKHNYVKKLTTHNECCGQKHYFGIS